MITPSTIKKKVRSNTFILLPATAIFILVCSFKVENKSLTSNDSADHRGNNIKSIQQDTTVYMVIDEYPKFQNGDSLIFPFIKSNMKYPGECKEKGIEGNVAVLAIVEKDGSILNVKILQSVDPLLDKEALRLVKSFPKFSPGKLNGNPVRVNVVFPIEFKL
jgi:TonB family protein